MKSFRLTVPGNLLLAGEYAVLEQGGLGWALAVEPRLTVTVQPADDWQITGIWPGGQETWTASQDPQGAGLAGRLFSQLFDQFQRTGGRRLPPARITADSSAFFDPAGRKTGLGSSAALTVGLAAALAGIEGRRGWDSIHQDAVQAHRAVQGGRGSGYDVTVSLFGGLGLFRGGTNPGWEPDRLEKLPVLALFAGSAEVRTVSAIASYESWKTENPEEAADYLAASNASVRKLTAAGTWGELFPLWKACRNLGLNLGERIGVSANLDTEKALGDLADREGPDGFLFKALGAGNETGLAAGEPKAFPQPLPSALKRLVPSPEGVREE